LAPPRPSGRRGPWGRAEAPGRTWGRGPLAPAQDAHWSLGRRFRTRARPRARRLCQLRQLLRSGRQQLGATNGATAMSDVVWKLGDVEHARRSRNTQEESGADSLFSVLYFRTPV